MSRGASPKGRCGSPSEAYELPDHQAGGSALNNDPKARPLAARNEMRLPRRSGRNRTSIGKSR